MTCHYHKRLELVNVMQIVKKKVIFKKALRVVMKKKKILKIKKTEEFLLYIFTLFYIYIYKKC